MSTDAFLAGFRDNPDFLLQNLNFQSKLGLVVRINKAAYRAASFLDQRVFTKETQGVWFPLDTLYEATAAASKLPAPYYIVHVGHCGSTLISRLLAELTGNLPVREPIALLALAMTRRELDQPTSWIDRIQWQRYYDLVTRALSRTYHPGERVLVKLTSTAGNLLELMLAPGQPAPQILLMHIRLEPLLAIMLRTPDMRDSLRADSPAWIMDFRRLTGRTDVRLSKLDDAQQVVIKWLVLMLLFTRALTTKPAQVSLLDFDDFLKNPARELSAIARHFHLTATNSEIGKLTNGPLMHSYSKIPAQPFNPGQRNQELREARSRFPDEIQNGLRWAETLCRETPVLECVRRYLQNGNPKP